MPRDLSPSWRYMNLFISPLYDTVYRKSGFDIVTEKTAERITFLIVDGKNIKFLSEKEPKGSSMEKFGYWYLLLSLPDFLQTMRNQRRIWTLERKRVVISAPVKGQSGRAGIVGETVLFGNQRRQTQKLRHQLQRFLHDERWQSAYRYFGWENRHWKSQQ